MSEDSKKMDWKSRLPVPPTIKEGEGAKEVLSVWARPHCRSFTFDVGAIDFQQWGEVLANVIDGLSQSAIQAGATAEGRPATLQEVRNSIVAAMGSELRVLGDAASKKQESS